MKTLDIAETITPGDGGDIPSSFVVEGLTLPLGYKSGLYTMKNVKLSSNGTIQLIATTETAWERHSFIFVVFNVRNIIKPIDHKYGP